MHEDHLSVVARLDCYRPIFEQAAAGIERDHSGWSILWNAPELRAIAMVGVPECITPHRFHTAGLGQSDCPYPLHLAIVERLARGGASALMALPSASLSSSAILKLGTDAQKDRFFAHYRSGDPAWSFFAVTEPHVGSDASQISATLAPHPGGGWLLNGTKTLVGGVAVARSGLVLARHADTDAPVLVIICDPAEAPGFTVRRLPMHGLRGAGICELSFRDFRLPNDAILGADQRLPAMMILSQVFERHRPMVAAMALGTLAGLLDRLPPQKTLEERQVHKVLLHRLMEVAEQIASGAAHAGQISLLKLQAVQALDGLKARLPDLAGPTLFSDPVLRRLVRDAGAFEYMEGASNIHKMNVARHFAQQPKLEIVS